MAMLRKITRGEYLIGMFHVEREGRYWIASNTGSMFPFAEQFRTLSDAHLKLTGEPLRDKLHRRYAPID